MIFGTETTQQYPITLDSKEGSCQIKQICTVKNMDRKKNPKNEIMQSSMKPKILIIKERDNTTKPFHGELQRRKQSDDMSNGLELTPDEQAERVNLFLLGFASIILMNALAVFIIVFVKSSEYEDQLVIKSNIIKRQIKGRCN